MSRIDAFPFPDNDAEGIVKNYFNYKINSEFRMRMRIIGNILIKLLYIVGNVAAFLIVDGILNGDYKTYGITWTTWSKLPNSMAYDYMGKSKFFIMDKNYSLCFGPSHVRF